MAGLEPLTVGVHQTDQGDGHAEMGLGNAGDPVEAFFRLGIQNTKTTKCGKPSSLILGDQGFLHKISPGASNGFGWPV